ncbi:MAG: hypothetical protein Q8M07_32110, partial [Prosthecobacter sp.]|nr:hypothetical protein [Prosthecobacter sp.]
MQETLNPQRGLVRGEPLEIAAARQRLQSLVRQLAGGEGDVLIPGRVAISSKVARVGFTFGFLEASRLPYT